MMNKSMLIGVVGGVVLATAGGVAGYSLLGETAQNENQADALLIDETIELSAPAQPEVIAAAAQAPQEECWDEEVTVQAQARDQHAVAGTTAGALIGGALAKKLGDDRDLATAAGAAAGAYLGRRAQQEYQDNNTTTTIERRCAPIGSR